MAEKKQIRRSVVDSIRTDLIKRDVVHAATSNYYIINVVLPARKTLHIPERESIHLKRPTILAFVDDMPLANWAHPCRYFLYDADSLEYYRQIPAEFPPVFLGRKAPGVLVPIHYPVSRAVLVPKPARLRPVLRPLRHGQVHALMFCGYSDASHVNDLEFLYRTLRDAYWVPRRNIRILNCNGSRAYLTTTGPELVTRWPGDRSRFRMTVHGPGDFSSFVQEIDRLRRTLNPDDTLLIHTSNHGYFTSVESTISCYPIGAITATQFGRQLARLPRHRCSIVMMQQCYSGGFRDQVLANSQADRTSFASACGPDEESNQGRDFGIFAKDWMAALMGCEPNGSPLRCNPDTNYDGCVSAAEAFHYAAVTCNYPGHFPLNETPLFGETRGGGRCCLGRVLFRAPSLSLNLGPIERKLQALDPAVREPLLDSLAKELSDLESELASESVARGKQLVGQLRKLITAGTTRQGAAR
jgi:hypothetical protein